MNELKPAMNELKRMDGSLIASSDTLTVRRLAEAKRRALAEANLRGENMEGANLRGAKMYDADMEGANLRGANMYDADMEGANLRGANMRGADMEGANMRGADMEGANLRGADMYDADMEGANMRGANMAGANLRGANMRGADMEGANMAGANMEDADMEGANLRGASGITSFGPCPGSHRIGYAVLHDTCVMVKLGCFWGTSDEAIAAVREKYKGPAADAYTGLIEAAVACLELQREEEAQKL